MQAQGEPLCKGTQLPVKETLPGSFPMMPAGSCPYAQVSIYSIVLKAALASLCPALAMAFPFCVTPIASFSNYLWYLLIRQVGVGGGSNLSLYKVRKGFNNKFNHIFLHPNGQS